MDNLPEQFRATAAVGSVPYSGEYFGLWMIHDETFRAMANQVNGTNLHVHVKSDETLERVAESDDSAYEVTPDGIAIFVLSGPLMKIVPSMGAGTSYLRLRQQLNAARRDPEVRGAILRSDTPGGTVRGNEDMVTAVAAFAAEKPIYCFVEDMTCSAGVSIASQATKRFANNGTAWYGSIGTYAAIQDTSGVAEKLGVKVHVVKAGESKGDGIPGVPITDDQLAELQRLVDAMNDNYLGLIAKGLGRSVESIRQYNTGRVILADDAVTAGLLDGVATLQQVYAELVKVVNGAAPSAFNSLKPDDAYAEVNDAILANVARVLGVPKQIGGVAATPQNVQALVETVSTGVDMSNVITPRVETMADKNPATLKELKQTFPNSSAEWRETQLEAEAELSAAAISYAQHVEAKANAAAEAHAAELAEAKANAAPSLSTGHAPLNAQSLNDGDVVNSGDPVLDFHAAVRERLPRTRSATYAERQSAIASVARTNPQLHRGFILASNKSPRASRLVREKYETPA